MLIDKRDKNTIRCENATRLREAQRRAGQEELILREIPDAVMEGLHFIHTSPGYKCDGGLTYEGRTLAQVTAHMALLPPVPASMAKGSFRSFAPTERVDDNFREVVNMVDTGPTARAVVTDIAPFLVRYTDHETTVEWWAQLGALGLFKVAVRVKPQVRIPVTRREHDHPACGSSRAVAWAEPDPPLLTGGATFPFNGGGAPMYVTAWPPTTTWQDVLPSSEPKS